MESIAISDSYDLLVRKGAANNSGGGTVSILFYYDKQGVPLVLDRTIFESGDCWVSSGYEEYIDKRFDEEELFLLRNTRKQDMENHSRASAGGSDWWVAGKSAEKLNGQFIRVLETELPDINDGRLYWGGSELQRGNYFLLDRETVYGLFELTLNKKNDELIYTATPIAKPSIPVSSHYVSKINLTDLFDKGVICEAEVKGEKFIYVTNLKDFGKCITDVSNQQIDYISADKLFSFLVEGLKDPSKKTKILSKSQLTELRSMISKLLQKKEGNLEIGSDRYERAITIIDQLDEDNFIELMNSWRERPEGRVALKKFGSSLEINNADTSSSPELKAQLREDTVRLENVQRLLGRAEEEKNSLLLSIETSKKTLNKQIETQEEKVKSAISNRQEILDQLEYKIAEAEEKGSSLKDKYSRYETMEALDAKVIELESTRKYLDSRVDEMKNLLQNPDKSGDALLQVHTILDLLGYARHTPKSNNKELHIYQPASQIQLHDGYSAADIVSTISSKISESKGRELSGIETANLLICIQQNFMIFLHGRPGNGKTSSALNLAKSLGIHSPEAFGPEADFLNIPVARGWSGTRDLVGYFNSLKNEFQPSQTGLYQFLVDGEGLEDNANLRLVLLDEANLSPIEHYFSAFISLFDKEGKGRPIDTGFTDSEHRYLHPARNNTLRFIATINNDSTTEPISARLLDRAPVISMDIIDEASVDGDELDFSGAVPAPVLESVFGRNENSDKVDLYILQSFIDKGVELAPSLADHLHLEGRRKQSIASYIYAATEQCDLMERSVAEDYAVAQFLLPHFRGDGAEVSEAIKRMCEYAEDNKWSRTSDILGRIQRDGDAYLHSYSFM